jgi:hypothetical protein
VHPLLEALEAGEAPLVEGDYLPVEHRRPVAERLAEAGELRVLAGQVVEVAALDPQPGAARLVVGQGPDPVPLDLVRPVPVLPGQRAPLGQGRTQVLGKRIGRGRDVLTVPTGRSPAILRT